MTRSNCPTPDQCCAPKRGNCRCQTTVSIRAKLSVAIKKALADPAVRAKMSMARKKAWADPEIREKLSVAMKKAWAAKRIPGPGEVCDAPGPVDPHDPVTGEVIDMAARAAA